MGKYSTLDGSFIRVDIDVPDGMFDFNVKRGELLGYIASVARSHIKRRTAKGMGEGMQPFPPYAKRIGIKRDLDKTFVVDGEKIHPIIRNEKGQWQKIEVPGRSNDVVNLRSLKDVADNMRMVESLDFYPQRVELDDNAKFVTLKPIGGRAGLSHMQRAQTVQLKKPFRKYIGLDGTELATVFGLCREAGALAFVKNQKNKWAEWDLAKANKKKQADERAQRRAEKAASLTDAQRHKLRLQTLRRLGLDPESDDAAIAARRDVRKKLSKLSSVKQREKQGLGRKDFVSLNRYDVARAAYARRRRG